MTVKAPCIESPSYQCRDGFSEYKTLTPQRSKKTKAGTKEALWALNQTEASKESSLGDDTLGVKREPLPSPPLTGFESAARRSPSLGTRRHDASILPSIEQPFDLPWAVAHMKSCAIDDCLAVMSGKTLELDPEFFSQNSVGVENNMYRSQTIA